mmetsp:Transcript_29610/g.48159  ORF Transcript_29610/g.48159 Transcript_29610/m.48159 type:complete len:238 (+) Transcript_29610:6-719(+)
MLSPERPAFWTPGVEGLVPLDLGIPEAIVGTRPSGNTLALGYLLGRFREGPDPRLTTAGGLLAVFRNQAGALWGRYTRRRTDIQEANAGDPNEKLLFFGGVPEDLEEITQTGFDYRHVLTDGPLGDAIHFTFNADLAHAFSFEAGSSPWGEREANLAGQQWATGLQVYRILLCRVAAGKRGPGQAGLRSPPPTLSGGVYSSVANPQAISDEMPVKCFTGVFDGQQVFPEFMFVYKYG